MSVARTTPGRLPGISGRGSSAVALAAVLLLAGCRTPDLKPFADASAVLTSSIKTGGDLAITPLARQPHWDGTRFVQPGEPGHPAKSLQDLWQERRKAADAVVVYAASLAAISDAASHRKEHAAELVDAVKDLASAVPGVNVGSGPAGGLMISALGILVEIKAWHDMAQAVKAADPAVQLIADVLQKDFASLSDEFESQMEDRISDRLVELRPVQRFHDAIRSARDQQRKKVEENPADPARLEELARLENLASVAAAEREALRSAIAATHDRLAAGRAFYASAAEAVAAWAAAHQDLARAFEQKRRPDLILLAARAQELHALIQELR